MIDELLDFYNRELKFIREEGRAFALLYPKIASRLRMSTGDTLEDPHVARLIESFALLCARLRLKIEDEFPEVCQSMLQVLYPHYVSPVPPVGICRFKATELAHENPDGVFIQRHARLETEDVDGQACAFRTCYATRVLPISITQAEYQKPPFTFPVEPTWTSRVEAAIRLRLRSDSDKLPIQKMNLSKLPLYMGSADSCGNELYEAWLRDTIGVGLFSSAAPTGTYLSASSIRPLGFAENEALLSHDARTIAAYRFLWEFFAVADKFRFLELDLGKHVSQVARQDLDIVIYLSKANARIQRELSNDTISLHCSPIVNLFRQLPEPIRMTGNQIEYRVIPSYRRPQGMEIYSIDRVTASSPGGTEYR
ncbi:MAG: type VI secretion system baseplate subunit TssF, partial [Pirellulaceae bacterium]|nr:type VI secretion system baseplate subunit TssF [Pirellulaceae bacterium]